MNLIVVFSFKGIDSLDDEDGGRIFGRTHRNWGIGSSVSISAPPADIQVPWYSQYAAIPKVIFGPE